MIQDDRRVKGADVQDVREILACTYLDILYLTGALVRDWRSTGEKGQKEIKQPQLSILLRYLDKYPEEAFLTKMPDFEEAYEAVSSVFPGRLSYRKFGVLWGTSGWSGNAWMHGATPGPTVQRLFFFVVNAIMREGEEGLRKFMDIVDIEAKARGFEGGIEELFTKGSWDVRGKKKDEVEIIEPE